MTIDIIVLAAVAIGFLVIGYVLGESTRGPMQPEQVEKYLKENFPTEWAAYKKGVDEGYLQGLRDGQGGLQ